MRAGVTGANDGIVSTAAMVLGVAAAVVIALAITGSVSAHLGRAPKTRAVLRTVGGGILAMAITFAIGSVLGTQL